MPARALTAADPDEVLDALADKALELQARGLLQGWLDGLAPEDVAQVRAAMARRAPAEAWRATPATMGHHLTPAEVELYPYVELLGRKFAELEDGTDPFQVWAVPAQYGKSSTVNWGLAWALDRNPHKRYITTSYADELATRNAEQVRDHLREHADDLNPMAQLRADARRKNRFRTRAGGGLLAAGIAAGITGFGAHGIVVDDPFKNWAEAHSEARRQLVWNTYRSVLWLRRTTSAAWVLIVMTRWHEDDLVGRLVKAGEADDGPRFTVTRLPEVAEAPDPDSTDPTLREPDPLGRLPGQILEPRRFDEQAVALKRRTLGSYLWAGMAQQRPAPDEGGELKRAWWRLEERAPTSADVWLSSWDTKLKDKEAGDYVVGQLWARVGSSYWLVDQLRGQWGQATTANAIALMVVRYPQCSQHLVENAGFGPEVMEALRRARPDYEVDDDTANALGMTDAERLAVAEVRQRGLAGLLPITPKGDKSVRARAVAPYIEAGDVHLVVGTWTPGYLDEAAAFPNGAHDDQVDATSQALSRLARPPGDLEQAQDSGVQVPTRRTTRGAAAGTQGRRRMR